MVLRHILLTKNVCNRFKNLLNAMNCLFSLVLLKASLTFCIVEKHTVSENHFCDLINLDALVESE